MNMFQARKRAIPKQKPTAQQKKSLFKIVVFIILCAGLWVFFAPGAGIMTLLEKRSQQKNLEREIAQLQQENKEIEKNIHRLENDPQYLEEVARKEHGLLKKNERVFLFPDSDHHESK